MGSALLRVWGIGNKENILIKENDIFYKI